MKIEINLPNELYEQAKLLAQAQHISVDEVFASAFSDHLLSWRRLKNRAARGSREAFLKVLDEDLPAKSSEFFSLLLQHPALTGHFIRLEPLDYRHIAGLSVAAAVDLSLYEWTAVPQGEIETEAYIKTALAGRDVGVAVPYAIVRAEDGVVVGCTRFFNLERWSWRPDHPRYGRQSPDVCEIGYTWLSGSAVRTAANTEAKLLMLSYAFEEWKTLGVCLHTDARNRRSRTAIERIGGKYDGTLRAHRLAVDQTPRDSARYSIVAAEWPDLKVRLTQMLARSLVKGPGR